MNAAKSKLATLGYEAELCLTDLGATAEAVVTRKLSERAFDGVVIGAGIFTVAPRCWTKRKSAHGRSMLRRRSELMAKLFRHAIGHGCCEFAATRRKRSFSRSVAGVRARRRAEPGQGHQSVA